MTFDPGETPTLLNSTSQAFFTTNIYKTFVMKIA